MAIKIFGIILLLFVLEITFLTTHKPITLDIKPLKINFSDVTFEDVDANILTTKGITTKLSAQKVLIYKDRNELYHVSTQLSGDNRLDYVRADKAVQRDNILHLMNNVLYKSSNNILLKSDDLLYNTKTEVASSLTPFRLLQNQATASGDSFIYNRKTNILRAKKINFIYKEDN